MMQTLKIAGGGHILVSGTMLGKDLNKATEAEINIEREKFMGMCFILHSHEGTYKKLLDDLKRSANLGRDEYPETLTEAFNLLVRESGEYDAVRRPFNSRYGRGRGGRGGRGRMSFCLRSKAEEMDVTSLILEQTITTVPKLLQEQTEKFIQMSLVSDANFWATIVMYVHM